MERDEAITKIRELLVRALSGLNEATVEGLAEEFYDVLHAAVEDEREHWIALSTVRNIDSLDS
jgi:hypothetical protein